MIEMTFKNVAVEKRFKRDMTHIEYSLFNEIYFIHFGFVT